MATPKKSTTPKKTKDSKKPSSKATTSKKTQQTKNPITKKTTTKNKISNGNVGHSDEVPVTSSDSNSEEVLVGPSSSSESDTAPEQNGLKITKKPTPKSKKGTPKRKQKEEESEEEEVEEVKSYIFPMERVRRIMRCGGSDLNLSQDAVFLVNKATEKFLEKFAEDSCAACVKDRKKSLAYKHLSTVVSKRKRYDFLADYVPEKIKAADALAKRKLTEEKAG